MLLEIGEVELATIHDMLCTLQRYERGDVVLVAFERDRKRAETRVTS